MLLVKQREHMWSGLSAGLDDDKTTAKQKMQRYGIRSSDFEFQNKKENRRDSTLYFVYLRAMGNDIYG